MCVCPRILYIKAFIAPVQRRVCVCLQRFRRTRPPIQEHSKTIRGAMLITISGRAPRPPQIRSQGCFKREKKTTLRNEFSMFNIRSVNMFIISCMECFGYIGSCGSGFDCVLSAWHRFIYTSSVAIILQIFSNSFQLNT